MAYEAFGEYRFNRAGRFIIGKAVQIIDAYQEMGFKLTLRQLYYQFVQLDIIPNTQKEYRRLGRLINLARLNGNIDWDAIEDRTRNLREHASWSSPQSILDNCAAGYRLDPWEDQEVYFEVHFEKDALSGVFEKLCAKWRIPFFACRGYTSQSEQYAAGKRLEAAAEAGKRVIVLHFGDHDPSGIDMSRDNRERLAMFMRDYGDDLDYRRLALNIKQVEKLKLPPNPAKQKDSRFKEYKKQFGNESWEVDAIKPPMLQELIDKNVKPEIDQPAWDKVIKREEQERTQLATLSTKWTDVTKFLKKKRKSRK